MFELSRRAILRSSASMLAILISGAALAKRGVRDPRIIPKLDMEADLRARALFGYTDRWSARAGDTVAFKVSHYEPDTYQAQLVKLMHRDGLSPTTAFSAVPLDAPLNGSYQGRTQEIYPGSYVHIDNTGAIDRLSSFSLVAGVYPTLLPGARRKPWAEWQHLICRWDAEAETGWSLGIDAAGHLAFKTGANGAVKQLRLTAPLPEKQWSDVGLVYDADAGTARLYQWPVARWSGERFAADRYSAEGQVGSVVHQGALRFGAAVGGPGNGAMPRPEGAYNGKLDTVRLVRGTHDASALLNLLGAMTPGAAAVKSKVAGFWDFAKGTGTTAVHDLSRSKLDGVTVNLPERGVTGVFWNGESIDWRDKPEHYGAIYFHEDDVYDAEWQTDFTYEIPQDLPSGVYAVHVKTDTAEDYIPFFVLAPQGKPRAKVALLMTTATYLAYANSHGHIWPVAKVRVDEGEGEPQFVDEWFTVIDGGDLSYNAFFRAHPEFPGGVYRAHTDGSPNRHASIYYPTYTLRPNMFNAWLSADLGFLGWLEHAGVDYDLITDEVMHQEGYDLLKDYQVVITTAHPEYASRTQIEAIDRFTGEGGRFMYLGGNGFFPVTAFHKELPGVIEVRHFGSFFVAPDNSENVYEFDGTRGITWEGAGLPPYSIFGVGFVLPLVLNGSGYYRPTAAARDPRARFIFNGIDDEIIGDFGAQGGGAAGVEVDAADYSRGTPPHALVVASSEGMVWPYDSTPLGAVDLRYRHFYPKPRADMVFFETPNGGAMFSTGSMGWIGALTHNGFDNNVQQLSTNVLQRFLDPAPFEG